MKTFKTLTAALLLTLAGMSMAQAQSKPATGAMTEAELKERLISLGYEPKDAPLSNNRMGYWINVPFKGQQASMFMQLSPSGANIWSTMNLAEIKPEHSTEGARFIKLFQLNQKHGPSHFYVTPDGKTICITRCLFNKNITAKELREHIDSLLDVTTQTTDNSNTNAWKVEKTSLNK